MATLDAVKRQLRSVEDLESIVRAMKALAAVRIRQAREAVTSLEAYRETVDLGLQVVVRGRTHRLSRGPEDKSGPMGVVVFGSDLGLAGRFNIRIAEFTHQRLPELEVDPDRRIVLAVGQRVVRELETLGHRVLIQLAAPSNVDAISAVAQDLLLEVDRLRARNGMERLVLFYNHHHAGADYRPHLVHLLPLNEEWLGGLGERPWEGPSRPRYRIPWEELSSALMQERLFLSVYGAAAESHASEHASRLAAMEAAEERVEERTRELTARFLRLRQGATTEELLDLVAGFVASEEDVSEELGG